MSLYRVLRTAKATLSRTFYLDEAATDATGSVSATVSREDGTVVQGPVVCSGPDVNHGYSFTFQGSDDLDRLALVWTATVAGDAIQIDHDRIEVVGGFYMGLGEARDIDPKFKDSGRYTTQQLIDRRNEVEDEFERICGQAFVPRFERETVSPGRFVDSRDRPLKLKWPRLRRVRAVTVGGVAWTSDKLTQFGSDPLGLLRYGVPGTGTSWPYGVGNIVVEYEHGLDYPPTGIVRVAKLRMKSLLLTTQSPLPDRAERIATTEVGTVFLAIAGPQQTGIPDVDAELARNPSPRPGFG